MDPTLRPWAPALAALLCATAACSDTKSGGGRPTPSAVGRAANLLASGNIGPEGGTLASQDGTLLLTVPPGAVAALTTFTIDLVTPNTAPGGLGTAYRLGPSGAGFDAPVTLTFHVGLTGATGGTSSFPPTSAPLSALGVAYQDASRFWLRAPGVARDAGAGTITVPTTHFSDWAVVDASATGDMVGRFVVSSSLGPRFTARGEATMNAAGSDASELYYLGGGTLTLLGPVVVGDVTCTPPTPALQPLVTNVVEVPTSPMRFWWGFSAMWERLACSDGSTRTVDVGFDTYGIYHVRCTRDYDALPGSPTITTDQIKGSYTIDCGTDGRLTTVFNVCTAASACTCTEAWCP